MATRLQLTVNMIACSFGTGILSMPWSTAGASLSIALVIVFLISVLMTVTIAILVQASERHQKFDICSLLTLLPGQISWSLTVLVTFVLWATLWLTLVGYIVTIADALEGIVDVHRVWIALASSAVILPLCFFDFSRLSFTSTLSTVTVANLFVLIANTAFSTDIAQDASICLAGFGPGSITMISVTCTSLIIQMCALPMYEELVGRTPKIFTNMTIVSFIILFFVYGGFSIVGYLAFGPGSKSNILNSLPRGAWGTATRVSYVVVIMSSYPMFLKPMIGSLRHSDFIQRRGWNIELITSTATVLIVVSCMLAAMVLDDLGFLNSLVGAIQCAVFAGICPCLVGRFLLGPKSDSWRWRLLMDVLAILCCLAGGAGLVYTGNYTSDLQHNCLLHHKPSNFHTSILKLFRDAMAKFA